MEDLPEILPKATQDLTDFQLVCELEWGIFVDCDRGLTDKEELRHYDVALEIESRMESGTWGQ